MNTERFGAIAGRYPGLKIAVVGDYFLDRYLEIDPLKAEISIETGLPVHNVTGVRSQPGAAGTILNNLVALGIGEIHAVGFCGDDGEGYELRCAMKAQKGVQLEHFRIASDRRTPVYCKPLVMEAGRAPRELNRLDSKNWTPTPEVLQLDLALRLATLSKQMDAMLLMDQVDLAETGVITRTVREAALTALQQRNDLTILADSRRGLSEFPPLAFKMNAAELARMIESSDVGNSIEAIKLQAAFLANRNGRPVFVTMAEQGIVGAIPGEAPEHVAAHPVRGEIDIVGAGDAVTANLSAALAAGATPREAMEIAMAAASLVIHQLGTTGTATIEEIASLI